MTRAALLGPHAQRRCSDVLTSMRPRRHTARIRTSHHAHRHTAPAEQTAKGHARHCRHASTCKNLGQCQAKRSGTVAYMSARSTCASACESQAKCQEVLCVCSVILVSACPSQAKRKEVLYVCSVILVSACPRQAKRQEVLCVCSVILVYVESGKTPRSLACLWRHS